MANRDDDRSARQIARGKTRKAGDRSAKLARDLMKVSQTAIGKLEIDDELREVIDRARGVVSHIARRRAERSLAGELRRHDLIGLADQLAKIHETGAPDVQILHLGEQWRTKLIEEGPAALAGFAEIGAARDDEAWPRLIDAARRERDTGRPPGAARALFRHIVEAIKDAQRAAEPPDDDDDDDNDDDDGGDDES
ncbi:MAG TPA: DUF615 domain-containing protein [Kofleriaceae bacterium]|nr:DUF615 domain-containing protein [Kofleriaceae bacterium]